MRKRNVCWPGFEPPSSRCYTDWKVPFTRLSRFASFFVYEIVSISNILEIKERYFVEDLLYIIPSKSNKHFTETSDVLKPIWGFKALSTFSRAIHKLDTIVELLTAEPIYPLTNYGH